MRPTLPRVLAGAAAALLSAAALTGCAPHAAVAGCVPKATAGDAVDAVTATGRFGAAPSVHFAAPIHATRTEVATVHPGSGAPIGSQQLVVVDVTLVNATTGATITKTQYTGDKAAATFVVGQVGIPGLAAAMVCAQPGERLTAVIPPSAGIPAATRPQTVAATDSIVAVVDVRRAYLARANGTDQVMPGGLPAVVLGPDGRPGVSLPENAPPKTLQVALLKAGSGSVVHRGDTVVLHYTGVVWKPGDPSNDTVFASTWAQRQPAVLPLTKGQQLVPGLVTALAGQRVGSQVLVVVPPAQGFGASATQAVPANAPLVYVVDILGKA